MLPCDVGGDLCIDPYSSETIATAIRNLKKGGPMTDPDTSAEGVERLAAWLESHADYSEALDTAATLRARWKARTEAAEAERDTQRAQKLAAWGLVDEATEILRDLCWCKERRTTMDAVREHARAFLVSREDEERG